MHWKLISDLDTEIIFNVISQYDLDEDCTDIELTTRDREMLPQLAMRDMERGGEPLIEIRVNQKKLEQLKGTVRAQQEFSETTGELEQTHSDIEERIYDFTVTDDVAVYHLLMNANAMRQMNGLPDIAPAELLNTISTYQYEISDSMKHMVLCTIDLDVMEQALEYAKKEEQK